MTGQLFESTQHPLGAAGIGEQPEIVAHQQNRVECPQRTIDSVERRLPHIAHAPLAADLQRARPDIYANHLVPLLLKVKRESACPRANIQDAPAHRFHRRPHVWLPIVERREIHRHIVRHVQKAVVPFDDFAAVYTRVIVVQTLAERVLVLVSACIHDRSDSIRLTARRLSILPAHAIKGKQKGLSRVSPFGRSRLSNPSSTTLDSLARSRRVPS